MSTTDLLIHSQSVGCSSCVKEEPPMTFQVALTGSDGVIVGSDRKRGVKTAESGYGEYQYQPAGKFVKSDDESVICASAGSPRSSSIALAIATQANSRQEPSGLGWINSLTEIADATAPDYMRGEVIVVRKHVRDMILVAYGQGRNTTSTKIEPHICTGIAAPARFLIEHFWEHAPVDALQSLVLLALDYAAHERPGDVGYGFDVMTVKEDAMSLTTYTPDDERIVCIRESFNRAALSVIYPSNS
jgi:hypothetical protein